MVTDVVLCVGEAAEKRAWLSVMELCYKFVDGWGSLVMLRWMWKINEELGLVMKLQEELYLMDVGAAMK